MKDISVLAIDAGRAFTKFSRHNDFGRITTDRFPSRIYKAKHQEFCHPTSKKAFDIAQTLWNGDAFYASKFIDIEKTNSKAESSPENFIGPHLTTIIGASINFANIEHSLDLLAVGLSYIEMMYFGNLVEEHFSNSTLFIGDRTIKIGKTIAIFSSFGGFIDLTSQMNEKEINKVKELRTLTIDIGYNKINWLITDGLKIIHTRCGCLEFSGMKKALKTIKSKIMKGENKYLSGNKIRLKHIALALADKRDAPAYFHNISLSKFVQDGILSAKNEIERLFKYHIGGISDIDEILVIGGGASFFGPEIQKRFSKKSLRVTIHPNVESAAGLLRLGADHLLRLRITNQ